MIDIICECMYVYDVYVNGRSIYPFVDSLKWILAELLLLVFFWGGGLGGMTGVPTVLPDSFLHKYIVWKPQFIFRQMRLIHL